MLIKFPSENKPKHPTGRKTKKENLNDDIPKILEEFTQSINMYISHFTTSGVIFQTNIDFKGQALWGQGPALL